MGWAWSRKTKGIYHKLHHLLPETPRQETSSEAWVKQLSVSVELWFLSVGLRGGVTWFVTQNQNFCLFFNTVSKTNDFLLLLFFHNTSGVFNLTPQVMQRTFVHLAEWKDFTCLWFETHHCHTHSFDSRVFHHLLKEFTSSSSNPTPLHFYVTGLKLTFCVLQNYDRKTSCK